MACIVPVKTLKNTTEISRLCHETAEPIFITKNGYGDMVLMSIETYERYMFQQNIYNKLEEAENDLRNGRVASVANVMKNLKKKYGL